MTVIITTNVADRYRGFLSSCMVEFSSGVYIMPFMSRAVRDRIWIVLKNWHDHVSEGNIIMIWPDKDAPSGAEYKHLGTGIKPLVQVQDIFLSFKPCG